MTWQSASTGNCLDAAPGDLAGRTVMLSVASQFEAARALLDLDGVARRIVVLPPDVTPRQYPAIIRDAEVQIIVCSAPKIFAGLGLRLLTVSVDGAGHGAPPPPDVSSEWLLLTSGTTGDPKLAIHSLAGLTGALPAPAPNSPRPNWATFYDIRRYGGLQIYLRGVWSGGKLILSRPEEAVGDHLKRLAAEGATHVSGTPTHWRRVLMSALPPGFAPAGVRLSGEIADQPLLDALRLAFPAASITVAYASTEAGVAFELNDGREGFPASYLDAPQAGVEMRLVGGCLELRSDRRALGYAGRPDLVLADAEGWVATGDMIELNGDRCYFLGRSNGVINVGGLKVHPEEIEAVINRHPTVRQSKVRARKSPIIGSVVIADVVLREAVADRDAETRAILDACATELAPHKVPAMVNIVEQIAMTPGGKVAR